MKPLIDLMPARARKYVYAVLSAGVALYGVWEATQGDWVQFTVAVVTTLVGLMATANTDTSSPERVDPADDVEFNNPDSPQFDTETR